MTVNPDKLRELAYTLSDDQRRLLREGLADGGPLDADALVAVLRDAGNHETFKELAADAGAGDAGVGDAGTVTTDGGTGDAGTSHPPTPPEPGLTRW
ncbi:hypothetical protein [Dactylosporangium sp. NPDC051541]|uniref:hypothetical protein n=1 Tax=Dactylosporangium sp. NPDC051541 TaxID=3363977 RepID=UPI0037A70BA5